MNQPSKPFGRRSFAPLIRTSAAVLGVFAIGYVAVIAAEHALPHAKAATQSALESPEMTAGHATAVLESRLPTHVSPAANSPDDERGGVEGSRECRPDAGIVTECIFN